MPGPQSRVKILDVPLLPPGVCSLCGTAGTDSRKFVDFGKTLDWYGAVYFCTECVKELAEAVGYIQVEPFDAMHTDYRLLQSMYAQLEQKFEAVKHALAHTIAGNHFECNSVDDFVGLIVDAMEESRKYPCGSDEPSNDYSLPDTSSSVEGSFGIRDSSNPDDPNTNDSGCVRTKSV